METPLPRLLLLLLLAAVASLTPGGRAAPTPAAGAVAAAAVGEVPSNATEAAALLEFKAGLTRARALADWQDPAQMCSAWTGVRCLASGQVTQLELNMRNLRGQVGWAALARLSSLSQLNLEVNFLSGSLSPQLPPSLSLLRLGQNKLTGPLPPGWQLPASLRELWLETNELSGTLPAGWALGGLEVLNLDRNLLSGVIPADFGAGSGLTSLYLSNNRLAGGIPEAWALPPRLAFLFLGGNALTGAVPPGWALPPSLLFLSLGANRLAGPLPTQLALPPQLQVLQLENNSFSGGLGPWPALPPSLTDLNLAYNRISGSLDPAFAPPPRLRSLWLDHNQLSGGIPQGWQLGRELDLDLSANQLNGTLPYWPALETTTVTVLPQQSGFTFCGEVPASPKYQYTDEERGAESAGSGGFTGQLGPGSLPPCNPNGTSPPPPGPSPPPSPSPPPPSEGGGSSTVAILGGVLGGVAGTTVVLGAVALFLRRRSRTAASDPEAQKGTDSAAGSLGSGRSGEGGGEQGRDGEGESADSRDLLLGSLGLRSAPAPAAGPPAGGAPRRVMLADLTTAAGLLALPSRPPPNPFWSPLSSTPTTTTDELALQQLGEGEAEHAQHDGSPDGSLQPSALPAATSVQQQPSAGGAMGASLRSWHRRECSEAPPASPFDATAGFSPSRGEGLLQPLGGPGPVAWPLLAGLPPSASSHTLTEACSSSVQNGECLSGCSDGVGGSAGSGRGSLSTGSGCHSTEPGSPSSGALLLEKYRSSVSDWGAVFAEAAAAVTAATAASDQAAAAAVAEAAFAAEAAAAAAARAGNSGGSGSGGLREGLAAGQLGGGGAGRSLSPAASPTAPCGAQSPALSHSLSHQDDSWQLDPRKIELCTHEDGALVELGAGGFGKVYQGVRSGVTPVAVKLLRRDAHQSGHGRAEHSVESMRREVEVMKACRDPNIVQFYGACIRGDWMMLVAEYMEGGDLSRSVALPDFRWRRRGRRVALDVARGLVFLHDHGIVHFDVKPSNILLSADGTAKLADMGLARFVSPEQYLTRTTSLGTFAWAAPEMILGKRCTPKADIYSLGVVLSEIVTGEMPVRGKLRALRVPEDCPQAVASLIDACMSSDPKQRPTAREVYEALRAAGR